MVIRLIISAALLAALAPGAGAQSLTLGEALRRADRGAFANRAADGAATAADARRLAPLRGVLPTLRFEAGWVRTTDPIGAFGTTLRQRAVTPAAFQPAVLNRPAPISNLGTAAIVEAPLLNLDAWAGRAAAGHAARAEAARRDWTRETTRADVVAAWSGALLAADRTLTLADASRAAHQHVRQADAMAGQGLVTRSDALLAAVRAGELDAELAAARADAAHARRALAVLLGDPADTAWSLPPTLPDTIPLLALAAEPLLPAERADVAAARLGAAAARADAVRARAEWLPRLNAFARWDWNDASVPAAGVPAWTIGVLAHWTPFAGGGDLAGRRQAAGLAQQADAGLAATRAAAALDRSRRDGQVAVAVERLRIAATGVAQAAEAHRVVARKYEGGLATIVELLDAAAAETGARLRERAARHDLLIAAAGRRLAAGQSLASLEPDASRPEN